MPSVLLSRDSGGVLGASSESEVPKKNNDDRIPQRPLGAGKVEYKMVNLSYRAERPDLNGITFVIKPQEKIDIIGAAKSLIISTLFRLYDHQGDILIDDVSICTLPLRYLRSHVSIILQNPLIFQ